MSYMCFLHHAVLHQPLIHFDLGTLGPLNIPKSFSTPPWWKGANVGERSNILVLVRTLASAKDQGCKWTHMKTGRFSVQPAQPTAQNNFDRSETLKMNLFKTMQTVGDLLLMICRSWPWISVTFISCYESHEMQCSSIIRNEETPKQLPFFSHLLPTIPHRTTPELKCHPRLHSRHNIQCWSWRAAPVAIFGRTLKVQVLLQNINEKRSFHLWADYERPKRWVLQKNPCGLIKAAVPEGLIGHFQPHKPPRSCMKIDILNSLYETIWLKLSSILKEMLQFAHVVMDSDTPNAYHHMKLLCFHNFVGKPKNDGFLDILWPLSWMTLSSRI